MANHTAEAPVDDRSDDDANMPDSGTPEDTGADMDPVMDDPFAPGVAKLMLSQTLLPPADHKGATVTIQVMTPMSLGNPRPIGADVKDWLSMQQKDRLSLQEQEELANALTGV